jgi:copper(I)-binding protein
MSSKISLLGLLLALLAAPAAAQVSVSEPWVRGTVPGQRGTGAFMSLKSATDTVLVSAASPAARVVEVHSMAMEGGTMNMRAVPKLPLPAGQSVELKPGGYHVMLMDLAQPLKEGDSVPVTLTFEDKDGRRSTVEVKAPVKGLAAIAPKR